MDNRTPTEPDSAPAPGVHRTGVILMAMGGPENPAEVGPFLASLFNDRHIIGIPQPLRWPFSRIMAAARKKEAARHYDRIGGGSPLKKWTSSQAEHLAARLNETGDSFRVTAGYSYSSPSIDEGLAKLIADGCTDVIGLPLYPQDSLATFGSVRDDFERAGKKHRRLKRLSLVRPYYDHPLYIKASAQLLRETLELSGERHKRRVLFTAHSLPQKLVDRGDPYRDQIEKTVSLILHEVPLDDYMISFQSRVGPVKWLEPSTIAATRRAAADGIETLVVMPIGFTCDHIETLYELDIELAEIAGNAGVKRFIRVACFNDQPLFIDLLSSLVQEAEG